MPDKPNQLKLLCKDTTLRNMLKGADQREPTVEEAIQRGILEYVGIKEKVRNRLVLKDIDVENEEMWVVEFWWV